MSPSNEEQVAGKVGASPTERDPRWAALVARDPAFEDKFVYAVKTTGVYCRPTCPSRLAKAKNVEFYPTREEAESAGFRACQRCRPNETSATDQHAAIIAEARRSEGADTLPTLTALAAALGVSPYYFHRLFKSVTGLSPKAYGAAQSAGRVRRQLSEGKIV